MFAPPPLPRTLAASLRDIQAEKPAVRASAVSDLVRHAARDDEARRTAIPLFEKALGDDSPVVRSAAAVALADVRGKEALPALLVAIEDVDAHTRQMAINALGEIGDPRAMPRLRRALTDARPDVRYQAVIAFTRIASAAQTDAKDGFEDVRFALGRALEDDDESVRYIALRLVEEHAEAKVDGVEETARTRRLEPLVPRVVALLEGPVPHVALAAAIALAKLGKPEGRRLILRVIDGTAKRASPDKEDEREAVEMAGALGLREAIPALERRAWGVTRVLRDTCAFHAKIALARMGHERAVGEILRDLGSAKRPVREGAVVAAGRARLAQARETIEKLADVDADLVRAALADIEGKPGSSGRSASESTESTEPDS
jgi:HEAT repeat protein